MVFNRENLTKAGLTAAIAGVASMVLYQENGTVQLGPLPELPTWAVVGSTVGASSMLGDVLAEQVINRLPQNRRAKNIENSLIKYGLSGVTSCVALKIGLGLPSANLPQAIALGSLSKFGGDATYDRVFSKRSGFIF